MLVGSVFSTLGALLGINLILRGNSLANPGIGMLDVISVIKFVIGGGVSVFIHVNPFKVTGEEVTSQVSTRLTKIGCRLHALRLRVILAPCMSRLLILPPGRIGSSHEMAFLHKPVT